MQMRSEAALGLLEGVPDLRTAAYILAIGKVAHYYQQYAL